MYKEHSSFDAIPDDTKIWRFMDFKKFKDLIKTRSLFFARPKTFKDPWEGYLTKKHFEESSYAGLPIFSRKFSIDFAKNSHPAMTRENLGVCCWHINEVESEAFWSKYSKKGIVIQSTFGRLKDSFKGSNYHNVYIGKVKYIDHEVEFVDIRNLFNSILWKRKSFEYENELRAVIWEQEFFGEGSPIPFTNSKGQLVNVDLEALIENIITTPFEKKNKFHNKVNKLLKKQGLNIQCLKSNLMDDPIKDK